jgi:hypothetical protein
MACELEMLMYCCPVYGMQAADARAIITGQNVHANNISLQSFRQQQQDSKTQWFIKRHKNPTKSTTTMEQGKNVLTTCNNSCSEEPYN